MTYLELRVKHGHNPTKFGFFRLLMSNCVMKIKDLTTTSESLLKVIVLLKTPLILCQSIGGYLTNKIVGNMFLIHLSVLKLSLNLNWLSIEGNFFKH